MVKERFKTFLLLLLVCISIFLTNQLWMKMPYKVFSLIKKEEYLGASYLLADMLEPHKYLLNFDRKTHTMFYSKHKENLWISTCPILSNVLSSSNFKTDVITDDEFFKYLKKRSIVFYFPEKFNTYILARSLEINKPNSITEKMPKVESIYLYIGSGKPFFIFSNENDHLMVYDIYDIDVDITTLKEYVKGIEETVDYTYYYPMKDTLGSNNNTFIPYEMSKNLPLVSVERKLNPENIEEIRDIAKEYFNKDIDYIREIVEKDGSIIYLYDQKVLKINQNGILEYFSPLEEPVLERNLYISLNTVAEFLSNHIDNPEDMYLAKIEEIKFEENLGYKLIFGHRVMGLPVILANNDIEDFIEIDVFNKYIRNYKIFSRENKNISNFNIEKNKRILSTFDIINMNYDILEKDYIYYKRLNKEKIDKKTIMEDTLSSICNIDIAYMDPCSKEQENKLIGVWLLETENKVYAFDVYSGELVFEK